MKTINLYALSEFTLEDLGCLVSWLETIPPSGISLERMKSNPPVRTSKIGAILKVIEPFGLIAKKQDRYALTPAGKDFSRSGATVKKAVLRDKFTKVDPIQRLVARLQTSTTGRLPMKVVHESFILGSLSIVSDTEILGLISWAQSCELFGFDKDSQEILRKDSGAPRGPTETIRGGDTAFTLPRAS